MGKEKKEKKPSLWRRFRSIDWSNPVNKWKGIFFGSVALVGIAGFSVAAFTVTSTTAFCKTCHEMAPEYASHQTSSHENVSCATCHIPPDGPVSFVMHKVGALAEVYYHITGIPNPLHQTEGKAVPNRTCQSCHSENRAIDEYTTGDLIVNHQGHIDAGIMCVNCHAGVAHGKVAERGLIYSEDLKYWDADDFDTANLLITERDRRPNMGTCMECHIKVNDGQKPYEDVKYVIPNFVREDGKKITERATLVYDYINPDTNEPMTQADILRLSQPKSGDKISMACSTCHTSITTPASHADSGWGGAHGDVAMKDAESCLSCHDDINWVRRLEHEEGGYKAALEKTKKDNAVTLPDSIRENQFCNSCHTDRPKSHQTDRWLALHASNSKTDEAKQGCYTCHNKNEPKDNEKTNAPANTSCATCHKTGFVKPLE